MSQDNDAPSAATSGAPESASNGASSAPTLKVELDIDDAPFLEEPEEEKPAPEPVPEVAPPPKEEKPKKEGLVARLKRLLQEKLLSSKKRMIIAGAALLLLILIPVSVMVLLSGPAEEEPEVPEVVEPEKTAPEPETIIIKSQPDEPAEPEKPENVVPFHDFFVPLRGSEGQIRILQCSFSVPFPEPVVGDEMMVRRIEIRDAIYYYLKNKPLTFLLGPDAATGLKEDVLSVINEHLTSGKVQEVLLKDYDVTGK